MNGEYVEVGEWFILNETRKAFLGRIGDMEFWIPKSQIADSGRYRRGYRGTLWITLWWLEVNELERLIQRQGSTGTSSAEAVHTAHRVYRRLAAKYHPDRSPETVEFMKDLNELWQAVLDDLRNR